MAIEVDPCDVQTITGSTLSEAVLLPFTLAAVSIVQGVSACATAKGVSDESLNLAATWLSAHLLSSSAVGKQSATVSEERFEGWSVKRVVGSFSGSGVMGTPYGQAANTLLAGCLAEADKAPAEIAFFG